jgi:hypothetical protein
VELLDSAGNIVVDAYKIIDAYLDHQPIEYPLQGLANFPCAPTTLQENIQLAFGDLQSTDASDLAYLSSYSPKIYGHTSKKLGDLDSSFIPYAEAIVAFIYYWCQSGGANDGRKYGFDLISTKRSWFTQQNIITGSDFSENGLSWSLYGKGLSISVFYYELDQLSELAKSEELIKKPINFEDGSAKTFIEDAQKWFTLHAMNNGRHVKVYGIYPDLKTAIKKDKYKLQAEYMLDSDTVFWGGLFSTYSNYTTWEYHPQLMPNEVWKVRQEYLNTCFVSDGNQNIIDLIEANESISYAEANSKLSDELSSSALSLIGINRTVSITKYLNTVLEVIEEDLISLYLLKQSINSSIQYSIVDLFKWAYNNPCSLALTILYNRVICDMHFAALLHLISLEPKVSITFDSNDVPSINSSYFSIVMVDDSTYCLKFTGSLGEDVLYNLSDLFKLPCDVMISTSDFDLIDLLGATQDTLSNTNSDYSDLSKISDEISKLASLVKDPLNNINEHGPLSGISVNPRKVLYRAEAIAKEANRIRNYNEMITPPDGYNKKSSSAVVDVTSAGKYLLAKSNSSVNEMIKPDSI